MCRKTNQTVYCVPFFFLYLCFPNQMLHICDLSLEFNGRGEKETSRHQVNDKKIYSETEKRLLKYIGYIIWKNCLENLILKGHVEGKRDSERQQPDKLVWTDNGPLCQEAWQKRKKKR